MSSTPMSAPSTADQPTGPGKWHELLLDRFRQASSVDEHKAALELCRSALEQEPGDIRLWKLFADWIWLLYKICHNVEEVYTSCPLEDELSKSLDAADKLAGKDLFQWHTVIDAFEEAFAAIQWQINDSHLIWDPYLELLSFELSHHQTPDKINALGKILKDRLRQPHATWENTFQSYSQFISKYDPDNYESIMKSARKSFAKARDDYALRETREQTLANAADSGNEYAELLGFQDYLTWEEAQLHRKKGVPPYARDLFLALCERAISRLPQQHELWADYIVFLMQRPIKSVPLLAVAERATTHCPSSGELWQLRVYVAEACALTFDEIHEIKHAATGPGRLQESGSMDEQIKLDYAWCSYLRRKAFKDGASDDDRDVAEMAIRSCMDEMMADGRKIHGQDFIGDPQFRLERVYLKFMAQAGRLKEGRKYFEELEHLYGNGSYFWERWYLWEMTVYSSPFDLEVQARFEPVYPPSQATAALERALKKPNLDWPEKIIEMYLHHCGQHETIHKLLEAITTTRKISKETAKLRAKQQADGTGAQQYYYGAEQKADVEMEDSTASNEHGKRKRDVALAQEAQGSALPAKRARNDEEPEHQAEDDPSADPSSAQTKQPKRDRENLTILVRHLPKSATEDSVRAFFKDCGEMKSLKILPDARHPNESTATIEFAGDEDVLAAQTRDKKKFEGNEINVQLATGTTLFVTNYPADADEKYMQTLFGQYGKIVDIRFPSLRYNTQRRFCYIQYVTGTQARAATALDRKALPGNLTLSVKISNPKIKQDRTGPSDEGREIFVGNIPWSADKADIERAFKPFGTIEKIRVPINLNGKHKAVAFISYTTKEDADSALAMNLQELKEGRLLKVEKTSGDKAIARRTATSWTRSLSQTPSEDVAMSGIEDAESPAASSSAGLREGGHHRDRSIAILNLPDTVNQEHVRRIFEPFGALKKVQLRPDHGGAIIEFDDEQSMGKARLQLDGSLAYGVRVQLGAVPELMAQTGRQHTPKSSRSSASAFATRPVPPPRPVQRPKQNPRRGGKGGLGFRGGSNMQSAMAASTMDGVEAAPTPAQSKSQADFRALLPGNNDKKGS